MFLIKIIRNNKILIYYFNLKPKLPDYSYILLSTYYASIFIFLWLSTIAIHLNQPQYQNHTSFSIMGHQINHANPFRFIFPLLLATTKVEKSPKDGINQCQSLIHVCTSVASPSVAKPDPITLHPTKHRPQLTGRRNVGSGLWHAKIDLRGFPLNRWSVIAFAFRLHWGLPRRY